MSPQAEAVEQTLKLVSSGPGHTRGVGQRLGEAAWAGTLLLLVGELGSGKTCLVQGLAQGLGVREGVLSPSFVLLRQYRGRLPLYHIDLFRLDRVEEVAALGLEDYLSGEGVVAVEWAEKALDLFPPEHLLIQFTFLSQTRRRLTLYPRGQKYLELARTVARR